jgi:glucose-fructose oxidoreductase
MLLRACKGRRKVSTTGWIAAAVMIGVGVVGLAAMVWQKTPSWPASEPRDVPLDNPHADTRPLRVVIAGMEHGHVDGFLAGARKRNDIEIVGIWETDRALFEAYAQKFGLSGSLRHEDLGEMLKATRPDAVLAYTNTLYHAQIVETVAKQAETVRRPGEAKPSVIMMEKPLAVSTKDAHAIVRFAEMANLTVIVNYETTWYRSNWGARELVKSAAIGDVRKVVVHDGHRGPKEIGVGPEFLRWLSDPGLNGGGALYDFGCYGADLMTWLMNGERPLTVTAVTQTIKPGTYPHVDDEATIVLTYPKAQAIVQASWNWPFDRKDMEVYGQTGYVKTISRDQMEVRLAGEVEAKKVVARIVPPPNDDPMNYLRAVVFDGWKPEGPGSLEANVVVAEILDAARESARTGKTLKMQ